MIMTSVSRSNDLQWSLLDQPLIRWRDNQARQLQRSSLPAVFAALTADKVGDFPALRPHQRHVWHALLVQLAAIAMHRAGRHEPWATETQWRLALLDLTPNDPDGAAWCLSSPCDRPAFMQAPSPGDDPRDWKKCCLAADEIDMLVTARNHDLKAARIRNAEPDDWLFALVSLQTQSGYSGARAYGVSRMNTGMGNRPGVGVAAVGEVGRRFRDDVSSLLASRSEIAQAHGLTETGGMALLWLSPWDGTDSLSMADLDPFYVEICRRVRLMSLDGQIVARTAGSKVRRVAAAERRGVTGDAWTPINAEKDAALTLHESGWTYKLLNDLLIGNRFRPGAAWRLDGWPADTCLELVAQTVVRGQGKTKGYHERRVPISPLLRPLLAGSQRADVAAIANRRIEEISLIRKLLWSALGRLFAHGNSGAQLSNSASDLAGRFARPFELGENSRFFDDLAQEAEAPSDVRSDIHLRWQLGLVERAEAVLCDAFATGPRNTLLLHRNRAAALARFRGALRSTTPVLPELAMHYSQQAALRAAAPNGTITHE